MLVEDAISDSRVTKNQKGIYNEKTGSYNINNSGNRNNLTREAAQEVNKALGLVKGKVLSTNQHRNSFFIVPRIRN